MIKNRFRIFLTLRCKTVSHQQYTTFRNTNPVLNNITEIPHASFQSVFTIRRKILSSAKNFPGYRFISI